MDIELIIPAAYAQQLQSLHPDGAERAAVAALRFYLDLGKPTLDELLLRAEAQGVKPAEVIKGLLQEPTDQPDSTSATTITPRKRGRTSNAERDKAIADQYLAGGVTYPLLAAKHGLSIIRVTQIVAQERARRRQANSEENT